MAEASPIPLLSLSGTAEDPEEESFEERFKDHNKEPVFNFPDKNQLVSAGELNLWRLYSTIQRWY